MPKGQRWLLKGTQMIKIFTSAIFKTIPEDSIIQDDDKPQELDNLGIIAEAFDATYYLSQYHDVLVAGNDPLNHFCVHGWKEGRRPNAWFDPNAYLAQRPDVDGTKVNPFLHFLINKDQKAELMKAELSKLRHQQFLYWSDIFWSDEDGTHPVVISATLPSKENIEIVRKAFDSEFYLANSPDVASTGVDPLLHFMMLGWIEGRDPHPDFSLSFYTRNNIDIQKYRENPYIHYLKHGKNEKWRRSVPVWEASVLDMFESDVGMQKRIAAAKALDPMVAQPNQPRRVTSPLLEARKMTDSVRDIRLELEGRTYRYIVAVPHVRMSGASRVASIFADALSKVADASEILVVTTDSSEAEYMSWFPDKIDRFDLSKFTTKFNYENQSRLLIDLMRGIRCKTLINVNSRLVWEAMRIYGRQLHAEYRMVTYLFTWDENPKGDRVGYPIQWLRDTADFHHLLLTDTRNLAHDVSTRLGFGTLDGEAAVLPVYTPMKDTGVRANRDKGRRNNSRVLWAGRFDPQKRVDILLAIARANPQLIFDVYGKAVLDNKGLDVHELPDNIEIKGTYTDLQEVLNTPYAAFLYTAQWDGLPTILLDIASAGLPIVAPDIGGIAELLDNDTGWLVPDFDDVAAYSAALREMVKNPELAREKAERMREKLTVQFAPQTYINTLSELVTAYDL